MPIAGRAAHMLETSPFPPVPIACEVEVEVYLALAAPMIGSPPAVVNAVIDVLHRAGHTHANHINMPVSPSCVWAAMNSKQGRSDYA